jgi:UDPglucose 6-dehydrogenase
MNIGIIGVGVVGSAIKLGFERLGHDVFFHDVKHNTSITDVLNTEVCYICVPTPENEDGSCNTVIVENVIDELVQNNYNGIIAIKSTVVPGTTENLLSKYEKLAFVPEFLRERCAISDFIQNHEVCVIGTHSDEIYEVIKSSHGNFPQEFVKCTPTEAEFSKYFHNVHNAMQIIFANSFYEVCTKMGVSYDNVKNSLKNRTNINFNYLNCNKNFRGFGGVCLPKDTAAMDYLCKKLNLDVEFFQNILDENSKYVTTVPDGMRL